MDAGWERLADLWTRSTGGANIAAEPGDKSSDIWFSGPRPAGMNEAAEWFQESLEKRSESCMLFFVGGPGAGKSHAASSIVEDLSPLSEPSDGLAHRKYRYQTIGRELLLINDATIQDSGEGHELAQEIQTAIDSNKNILACVNRGVLVEELASINKGKAGLTEAADILQWIHDPGVLENQDHQLRASANQSEYFSACELYRNDNHMASIGIVYVDVCSMLEKTPAVRVPLGTSTSVLEIVPKAYEVMQFPKRRNMDNHEMAAGELLERIITDITNHFSGGLTGIDPVSANLLTLQDPLAQKGLLTILRAAELVSGQRLTYRDLWGAFARCILGSLPENSNKVEALQRTREIIEFDTAPFSDVKKLASVRFSQALFITSSGEAAMENLERHPVLRLTSQVDPVRDSRPASGSTLNDSPQISRVINEAFSNYGAESSPLKYLTEGPLAEFSKFVTPFDWEIDKAFQRELRVKSSIPRDVRAATAWYARYLTRFFSCTSGFPAFLDELSIWTDSWTISPQIPSKLAAGLRTLLIPKRDPKTSGSKPIMPILDSRVLPILGNVKTARLAIAADDIEFATETRGEEIFLILRDGQTDIATMSLDFALVREALAASSNEPGVTEVSGQTAPRLERFRASRLVPNRSNSNKYVVAHGTTETAFSIKKMEA